MTAAFLDVTVVVTAHDAGPALTTRLRSLLDGARFAAVWVMDSASADGSVAAAAAAIPELRTERFEENVGPCVTRNRGLEVASTPLVLWLDDDTEVDAASIAALRAALLASEDRVIAGPSLRFADRREVVQYEGGVCHYAGQPHMLRHEDPGVGGEPREVDVLTSGCALVRREPIRECGGFDRHLFFLMEDVELSLRLRIAGLRLVVVPEAVAVNAGGSAGVSLESDAYPQRRVFLHARNRSLVVLGLWEWTSLALLWPALLLFEAAWLVFATLAGHPLAYVRGKLAVVAHLGHVRRVRARVRASRQVRDRDLLGAPPLTFTASAMAQPLARQCARTLDVLMRLYFHAARGLMP
ncbi:MAG: glycosyltransferase [Planctomycetota bacterium]|nr:hypothetical protein [Planctomycetota bacterium]MEE2713984.1 glycosyltransferase [Planctomycetota bacterium]